ncbi:MAG: hypothetical protein A3F16_08185 [Deltaproteobacteria bacterium RIFCSPHIGHO2_12_FULL_43_9]|nr:MAG: hypothetical protein A3F16_08185 [Deltaproteobacteria bacterium RIFCSPHIGHO2_12_FULL_43_9]
MSSTMIKKGNVTIVRFYGEINYESVQPVLDEAQKLAKEKKGNKILFNFHDARFVGSSNLTKLLQTMRSFRKTKSIQTSFCCMNNEFMRMLKAYQGKDPVEVFESEQEAVGKIDN